MANSIIREREVAGADNSTEIQGGARGDVVDAIMSDIVLWRRLRDGDHEAIWDEYYAKWRGFWMPSHKNYKTERSKLIAPLTQMAIDLSASEIIEATVGREYFIDLPDDVDDKDTADVEQARNRLCTELRNDGFIDEFASATLNGCLYGTGIFKIQITTSVEKIPVRDPKTKKLVVNEREVVNVKPIAIEPGAFVFDPSGRNIDEMKGCAHEFVIPLHNIRKKQSEGQYYNDMVVSEWNARRISPNRGDTDEGNRKNHGEVAYITEYYGLIPTRVFQRSVAEGKGIELPDEVVLAIPEHDMTEVIATIANESTLLRVIANPLITGERLVVSYQHETVPNRFLGRGVAEKGANVQRAMDAEIRARIDALAWSNNPMFAGDLTRLPPNSNLNAWPGKFWGTRGDPGKVLQEFKVTGPDQNSFAHTQELERMGQQATGALDSASMRQGMRDETATGSALAASSAIKRSKRTMFNIEGMMNRLVTRVLRLKMQFDAQAYPQDYDFQVRGTMGIMAREVESQQMTNLVSIVGGDSPAAMPIIKSILEHNGSPVKSEVLAALKEQEEKQPTPEEEAAKAAQLRAPVAQVEKIEAEIAKIKSETEFTGMKAFKTKEEAENIDASQNIANITALNDLQETDNQRRQMDLSDRKLDLDERKFKLQAFTAGAKITESKAKLNKK